TPQRALGSPSAVLAGCRGGHGFAGADAYAAIARVTLLKQSVERQSLQLREVSEDCLLDVLGSLTVVAVRSTLRFRNDALNQAKCMEVGGSDAHGFGGACSVLGVAPQDRCSGLGRGDGIDGMLQHKDAVGNADCEGAAAAALTDHDGEYGRAQL